MKRLKYNIDINAPAAKVSDTMLGKATYKQWTEAFNPTSDFEGSWDKGASIQFTGISKEGKKEGMVAEVMEHIPNEFVSLRHYGVLDGEQVISEGPAVEGWAGALENYSFNEQDGKTTVTVEVDCNEQYLDYFDNAWPKALDKLKKLAEQ